MKLQLIVPAMKKGMRKARKTLCPPLAPAVLASLAPENWQVSITDENVSVIDYDQDDDIAGITAITATANRAYEIADEFRSRGVKVVLGGIHPSVMPDEALEHADAVVVGEAENLWPQLIKDFEGGVLKRIYRQKERPSLTGLPVPRRDLFKESTYFFPNTVSTTRGCPFNCSFCSVTLFSGNTYRCRPLAEVIDEVKGLNAKAPIIFVDDNIVGKSSYAKELFKALIPLKIKWIGQASVNIARDDELLSLAAASGCVGLLIGFESLSPASLVSVGKKINVIEDYERTIKKLHAWKIAIHGAFIFGLDDDDDEIFNRTVRFARKMHLESAQFSIAIPHPGTALYKSLDDAGRITSRNWADYNDQVVYAPKTLTAEALNAGMESSVLSFFSLFSIIQRLGIFHKNLLIWWFANISFRSHFRHKWKENGRK